MASSRKDLLNRYAELGFRHGDVRGAQTAVRLEIQERKEQYEELKKEIEDLPILLQSSDSSKAELAADYGISFLNKRSPTLLNDLGAFVFHNFGFGDFVFKMPDGTELARANNFRSMEKCFSEVDAESLIYHANNNHYSNWLLARTECDSFRGDMA